MIEGSGEQGQRPLGQSTRRACKFCQSRHLKCDGFQPCHQCYHRNRECLFAPHTSKRTTPRQIRAREQVADEEMTNANMKWSNRSDETIHHGGVFPIDSEYGEITQNQLSHSSSNISSCTTGTHVIGSKVKLDKLARLSTVKRKCSENTNPAVSFMDEDRQDIKSELYHTDKADSSNSRPLRYAAPASVKTLPGSSPHIQNTNQFNLESFLSQCDLLDTSNDSNSTSVNSNEHEIFDNMAKNSSHLSYNLEQLSSLATTWPSNHNNQQELYDQNNNKIKNIQSSLPQKQPSPHSSSTQLETSMTRNSNDMMLSDDANNRSSRMSYSDKDVLLVNSLLNLNNSHSPIMNIEGEDESSTLDNHHPEPSLNPPRSIKLSHPEHYPQQLLSNANSTICSFPFYYYPFYQLTLVDPVSFQMISCMGKSQLENLSTEILVKVFITSSMVTSGLQSSPLNYVQNNDRHCKLALQALKILLHNKRAHIDTNYAYHMICSIELLSYFFIGVNQFSRVRVLCSQAYHIFMSHQKYLSNTSMGYRIFGMQIGSSISLEDIEYWLGKARFINVHPISILDSSSWVVLSFFLTHTVIALGDGDPLPSRPLSLTTREYAYKVSALQTIDHGEKAVRIFAATMSQNNDTFNLQMSQVHLAIFNGCRSLILWQCGHEKEAISCAKQLMFAPKVDMASRLIFLITLCYVAQVLRHLRQQMLFSQAIQQIEREGAKSYPYVQIILTELKKPLPCLDHPNELPNSVMTTSMTSSNPSLSMESIKSSSSPTFDLVTIDSELSDSLNSVNNGHLTYERTMSSAAPMEKTSPSQGKVGHDKPNNMTSNSSHGHHALHPSESLLSGHHITYQSLNGRDPSTNNVFIPSSNDNLNRTNLNSCRHIHMNSSSKKVGVSTSSISTTNISPSITDQLQMLNNGNDKLTQSVSSLYSSIGGFPKLENNKSLVMLPRTEEESNQPVIALSLSTNSLANSYPIFASSCSFPQFLANSENSLLSVRPPMKPNGNIISLQRGIPSVIHNQSTSPHMESGSPQLSISPLLTFQGGGISPHSFLQSGPSPLPQGISPFATLPSQLIQPQLMQHLQHSFSPQIGNFLGISNFGFTFSPGGVGNGSQAQSISPSWPITPLNDMMDSPDQIWS